MGAGLTPKTLFPYFGGKTKAARLVWRELGSPECYVEPFLGSGAVLLARRSAPRAEVGVDLDGLVTNFWRCLAADWRAMTPYMSGPVSELDEYAANEALIAARCGLTAKLRDDRRFYDPELAGWWWAGMSSWIGSGFGHRHARQRPQIDRSMRGLYGLGMTDDRIAAVAARIANVTLLADDWEDGWKRAVMPYFAKRFTTVGVFLDPPYSGDREKGLYGEDVHLRERIVEWALAQPENVRLVIAGYADEYPEFAAVRPASGFRWDQISWSVPNGYAIRNANIERRNSEVLLVRKRVRLVRRRTEPIHATER